MPRLEGRSDTPGNSTKYYPIRLHQMPKPALLQPDKTMGNSREGSPVKGKKMPGWEKGKYHLGKKGYKRAGE